MKEIHVSDIAEMYWCEVKAVRRWRSRVEGEAGFETPEQREGTTRHAELGFESKPPRSLVVGDYIIVGHPDALTRGEVVEFKTWRRRYHLSELIAVARCQANIYGLLTGRRKFIILVEKSDVKGKPTMAFEFLTNRYEALRDIAYFILLIEGKITPTPTKKRWKCAVCEYAPECPFAPKKKARRYAKTPKRYVRVKIPEGAKMVAVIRRGGAVSYGVLVKETRRYLWLAFDIIEEFGEANVVKIPRREVLEVIDLGTFRTETNPRPSD